MIDKWEKFYDKENNIDYYQIYTIINNCKYYLTIWDYEYSKNIKLFVGASSGKKRKHKNTFEEKDEKSLGGIKSLLWIKSEMIKFAIEYANKWYNKKDIYLCVGWADSRRKKIYSRLINDGFKLSKIDGDECLIKIFKNENIEK